MKIKLELNEVEQAIKEFASKKTNLNMCYMGEDIDIFDDDGNEYYDLSYVEITVSDKENSQQLEREDGN